MIFIIGIVLIIVVISLIAALFSSGDQIAAVQANVEWERRMTSRVAAYRDFIRREGNENWKKLSDNELEDMIANAVRGVARDIRHLRSVKSWAYWISLIPSIFGFMYVGMGVIGGSPDGQILITMYIISGICGLVAAYFISRMVVTWRGNAIDRAWVSRGWDVDKLIV